MRSELHLRPDTRTAKPFGHISRPEKHNDWLIPASVLAALAFGFYQLAQHPELLFNLK